jgi:Lectin C-type domain/PEP-CTERM motif
MNNLTTKLSLAIGTAVVGFTVMGTSSAQAASFYYGGNEYFLTNQAGSWTNSQSEAQTAGGNLVTINDAAEQNWLVNTFGNNQLFWIGFTDQAQEGNFQWISGEPVTYTNWSGGEPNNWSNIEDHTVMNWGNSGKWNDYPNTGYASLRGIIEKKVPEPGTVLSLALLGIGGLVSRKKLTNGKKS